MCRVLCGLLALRGTQIRFRKSRFFRFEFLEASIAVDPYPYVQVGSRVEVIAGPLKGIRGLLVEKRGKFRFVIQVDLIRQSVSVEIDASDVRPV